MEQVFYFKMLNGNDIVAAVLEEDGAHIKIDNPKQVRWMPDPRQGTFGMNLTHWVPHALSTSVHIHKDHVLLMERVDDDLEHYYNHVVEMELAMQEGDSEKAHALMERQMIEYRKMEADHHKMEESVSAAEYLLGNNVSTLIH